MERPSCALLICRVVEHTLVLVLLESWSRGLWSSLATSLGRHPAFLSPDPIREINIATEMWCCPIEISLAW